MRVDLVASPLDKTFSIQVLQNEPRDHPSAGRLGGGLEFVGTVEAIDPEKRVWVLLELLGPKSRVKRDAKNLVNSE